ncbi:G-type lectin S-receptor-like serine/threonine-protein kinase At4g27290, partial [Cajanus cajan]|uniref:G-type lectin S-receptor-like serine/threonine-protein kinase At4g27290 n=1 Tax=Cajanus cajan TaxID=3821 RepID=UPI0010FB46DE
TLVIRDENAAKSNPKAYMWQSFDYPSNTMLAGMKIGWDLKRNLSRSLIAWKSGDDPTPGDLSWGILLHPYPEIYMMKGTKYYHRLGPWNGLRFSGRPWPEMTNNNSFFHYQFVSNKEEVYYTWTLKQTRLLSKVVLDQFTQERVRYKWSETDKSWRIYSTMPEDGCDHYGLCKANAFCSSTSSPVCECLKGFKPKSPKEWSSMIWTQGCVLKHPLSCKYDGFSQVDGLKVPDTKRTSVDETIDLEKCRKKCLNDCSCMAYTNTNISGTGSGCVMWFGDLIDIKQYPVPENGQRLYIRLPPSELDSEESIRRKNYKIILVTSSAATLGVMLAIYFVYRRKFSDRSKTKDNIERQLEDLDVPLFDLLTITNATNNFSLNNKIGQGGFGRVYKGQLADGRDVAVKRLSSGSGQGITEFITEVKLIAKLQHRNLVKLLGCCFRGQEKLLIYEYMVNGSLDSFIFDQIKGKLLDWPRRFQIIFGIARGFLYLHQDSRLKIIPRDLKASNVLLDEKLNPKISDFGMAKAFGGDQTEGNTNIVVGTYGYMAPEYAVDGLFSIKSDVFSFGILLLEIVCGSKNRALFHRNQTLNLVGYAWTLWKEHNVLQLIDSSIKDSCVIPEVLRCIHVSLLCVQQCPDDRPTMTSVIQMLGCEMELVEPHEPGFFPRRISEEGKLCTNLNQMTSNDELTISWLDGRSVNNTSYTHSFQHLLLDKLIYSMKFILSLMRIIVYILFLPSLVVFIAADTSSTSQFQSLSYEEKETIVSPNGIFELGFFHLGNPNKSYLAIRYKSYPDQTFIWVANGSYPINDSSAMLTLNSSSGSLVLTHTNKVVWSSSPKVAHNPVAELLDTGNLVIREKNEAKVEVEGEAYLWQSFDYPSNTMLAGMKIGWDLKRNLNRSLIAWKSGDDPTPGDLSWGILLHPYPEIYMMKGTKKYHRLGPWNGVRFSGMPEMVPNPVFSYKFVSNEDEVYYMWTLQTNLITKVVLNQTTEDRPRYVWSDTDKTWNFYSTMPGGEYCDHYGVCGANSFCSSTASPMCECLKGYKPMSPEKWNSINWTQGCGLKHQLTCMNDGFASVDGLKVPDTTNTSVDETIDLEKCRKKCLKDCSCMAYTNSNISGAGSGCVMWFGDLFDIKLYPASGSGQRLYIRLHPSELDSIKHKKPTKIFVTSGAAAIAIILAIYFVYRRKIYEKSKEENNYENYMDDLDLPLLDFSVIIAATGNFSEGNKIGEGGFGSVYWGKLTSGLEIAVKRLSKNSDQGMSEFVNEVKLIAKVQHRNLVKLLGCCIQKQEKMLVYEYMTNGSLDYFIFDRTKGKLLDWQKRFHIICGIARGLMYLHQDSRLRIIHRDLKASNILLDDTLNPKISDFGMARTFGGEDIEGNTNRIVGTYGYMAPEYAIEGQFSVKSDVFSFGILLLEIICGKKNRSYSGKQVVNLVDHVWTLWEKNMTLQIIDPNMEDSCIASEVLRFIHVGLLCIQQYAEDRPTMTSVVLMLGSDMELDEPKKPGFSTKKESNESNSHSCSTTNSMSVTLLTAR